MRFGGLIFAIVIAAVAAFIVLSMSGGSSSQVAMNPGDAPQQNVRTTNVLVAARTITPGTLITDDMLEVQPWPEHLVVKGFAIAGDNTVSGMISRGTFQPQEPIVVNKLVNKSDPNFIAGTLPKGMRMVTIQTNETDGLAGFVFPGDRVDVMLTHEVEEDKWVSPPDRTNTLQRVTEQKEFTETLLTNVRVIAVDQRASGGVGEDGTIPIPRSVSLAVSQMDGQRLRLGQKVGTLALALRSLQDKESADPIMVTALNDISQYKQPEQQAQAKTSSGGVMVVRGIQSQESTAPQPSLDLATQMASSAVAPSQGVVQVAPAVAVVDPSNSL